MKYKQQLRTKLFVNTINLTIKNINNILLNLPLNTLKTSYIKVHHGKSHFGITKKTCDEKC